MPDVSSDIERYLALTNASGLDERETDAFIDGLLGGYNRRSVELARTSFDHLQAHTERAILSGTFPDMTQDYPVDLCYLTENPPTPFYRPEHSRRGVMETAFSSTTGDLRACSVFSRDGFEKTVRSMDLRQKNAFREFLQANRRAAGGPSIALTPSKYATVHAAATGIHGVTFNYCAVPGGENRAPFAFEAPQSDPKALSAAPGHVFFGNLPEQVIEMTLQQFHREWERYGPQKILELLGE